jgi:polyketide biosynthesis enoyl-CoA hydratase PksH
MTFETIKLRLEPPVCTIQIDRAAASNSINRTLVDECGQALATCEEPSVHIVVIEGLPEVFCSGADFHDYAEDAARNAVDPDALYQLWQRLACGPYISIAHVRGKANAGGVGFAAACDIVLADTAAQFSLSELLFGVYPACVLPFLIRRVGFQRAHYMTLTTKPVMVEQALDWGLVDDGAADSAALLRKHLLRLRRLQKTGIRSYKTYANALNPILTQSRAAAVAANRDLFADPANRAAIGRFARTGLFPWEHES